MLSFGGSHSDESWKFDPKLVEDTGADGRLSLLYRFLYLFKDLVTVKNTNALLPIIHGFLIAILTEAYDPEHLSVPHPSHGEVCHRFRNDDDGHWSVVLAHCGGCGKFSDTLKFCARCHAAAYCNADCQRKAWPMHKHSCRVAE